jgi:peptidoglycan hydrolase CwlO-like protein
MRRSLLLAASLTILFVSTCAAQSANSSSPQDTASNPAPPVSSPVTASPESKKPKKVWTNENLSEANGPVSVVGNSKGGAKPPSSPAKPADAKYIADTKKQLDKLQGEISDLDKQINQLKNFSEGAPASYSGATKINKSYNRDPVNVQIQELQDKKKQTQGQIDALLDEARKKGVEPGQLR